MLTGSCYSFIHVTTCIYNRLHTLHGMTLMIKEYSESPVLKEGIMYACYHMNIYIAIATNEPGLQYESNVIY